MYLVHISVTQRRHNVCTKIYRCLKTRCNNNNNITWKECLLFAALYVTTFYIFLPWLCKDWVYSVYFTGKPDDATYFNRAMELNGKRLASAERYVKELRESLTEEEQLDQTNQVQSVNKEFMYNKIINNPHLSIDTKELIEKMGAQSQPSSYINNNKIGVKTTSNLDLAIVVIGIHRKYDDRNVGYLKQTMASLHAQIHTDTLFTKDLFICHIDPDRVEFNEELGMWKDLVKVKYRNTSATGYYNSDESNIFLKSKNDYAFCLDQALEHSPKYVLVLEGDIRIKPKFFQNLYYHIYTNLHLEQDILLHQSNIVNTNDWAYIKLYYPEKWSGYGMEMQHITENIGLALLGGCVFVFLKFLSFTLQSVLQLKTASRNGPNHINIWPHQSGSARFWFVAGSIYFLALSRSIGRPYILDWFQILPFFSRLVPDKGCCTPAVLYNARHVTSLAQYLYGHSEGHKLGYDVYMDYFAQETGLRTYLTEPYLVQHFGMVSTLRQTAKKAAHYIF